MIKKVVGKWALNAAWKYIHDDVIKWKHFPHYWPFVRGIHRSLVNSPRKGQWRGALMLSFICVWINGWVNNHKAGDLRCYRAHYDVTVMYHSSSLIKYSKKYLGIFMWHASFWVLYSRKSRQKCHMTTLLSLLAWIKYEYLSPKHTKYRFRHPGGPFGQEGSG